MRELSTRGKGRGSISAGYEVDLWGRIEAAQDAAEWDVKASQADLHTAAITVSSNVVQVWFELVAARGQKQLTEKQLKVNQDYLELVSMRFRRGEVPVTDVLQQRKLIENRRGTLSQIESQIVKLETQLSVLLGESPDTLVFSPSKQLPDLPPLPKAGVPAELLLRRPDVAAAWARLKAAASRYVETEADKYPSLNLSINAQTSAEKLKQVLDSWVTTLAANLAAPLLDGGRRGAEARRALAAYHERVAGYRQTVLDALKEVYDALEAERHQVAYIQSLDKQLALSQSSLDQILTRYRKGAMPYTRYLTAVLDRQQLQVTRLNAKRDLIVNRIALYRAVAGRLELPELVHSANE
jgi:NodT family efflux transporter outer membrane factor (OMF) lipoprotein